VVATIFIFSAVFNQAVSAKMNSFLVPDSAIVRKLLGLFMRHRYVFYYRSSDVDCAKLIVFPNHFAIDFKLRNCSVPSRRDALSSSAMRSSLNSGVSYVVWFRGGFEFSSFFYLIRRKKSTPVFKIV